jgi:hypothetical protein
MLGVASRLDVQVGVVAGGSLRLHGIVPVVGGELLDLVVDLLTYEVALFDPSGGAGCGADFDEAAVVVEDFDAVAVFYDSGFFVDGGYAVAKDGLDSGNVGDFEDASAVAVAGGEQDEAEERIDGQESGGGSVSRGSLFNIARGRVSRRGHVKHPRFTGPWNPTSRKTREVGHPAGPKNPQILGTVKSQSMEEIFHPPKYFHYLENSPDPDRGIPLLEKREKWGTRQAQLLPRDV